MANPTTITQTFPVLGLSCGACAVSVQSMLSRLPEVKSAEVNYATQEAVVTYLPHTDLHKLQQSLQSIGYDLVIDTFNAEQIKEEAQTESYEELKHRTIWSLVLAAPVMVLGMFFMDLPYGNYLQMLLAAPVVFWFGRHFFVHAYKQAKQGMANMDTLVALSTSIAFAFSVFNTFYPEFWHSRGLHAHVYYEAAAVVVAFVSLGKWLEEKAKSNTSSALHKLIGLQPKTVTTMINQTEVELPISEVQVDYLLVAKPGQKIAVDGVVVSGQSFVDESMITGEPIAVEKVKADKVFAGSLNTKGSFVYQAQKVGAQTFLAQIIKSVQQAQASKAPVQKLVDKIAGIFVPVVLLIAVLTFAAWLIFGGNNGFTYGLLNAVTVLVIACPCALGLATPTAIMVGVGKAASHQILIKDAQSLELAHAVNVVVMDKTGTITKGVPKVLHTWVDEQCDNEQKAVFVSIEKKSEHPLADAVVDLFVNENPTLDANLSLQNFTSITGKGVQAQYQNQTYYIGNLALMKQQGIEVSAAAQTMIAAWQSRAYTVVYLANSQQVLMLMAIADEIKETSAQAVALLQKQGIAVYMLTGDALATATMVANEVGITNIQANLLPADKANFIKQLQAQGKVVAMVGDGINDSEALAIADVGIAMGKGTDVAMDVAKITLITSDLTAIAKALQLSTQTIKTIRQNLFWAFIYNVIGIPLAAGVLYSYNGFLLNPMIASAAMALSSVSVVSNSLRLKFISLK
jgi:Cu2+-exporting ATPase